MTRARIIWSAAELAWIGANRTLPRRELHAAFLARFKRADVALGAFKSLCKRKGWLTGRVSGECLMGTSRRFSQSELDFIAARTEMPRRELHELFVAAFGRSDVAFTAFKSLCKRRGFMTGRDGRIEKGSVPPNKGKKMPFNAANAATQFKPGQTPKNVKFEGHERVDKDGYVLVSVNERNPHTGFERRYVHKHRWLWEAANGPIPEGHVLKCLDADKTNTAPENWEAIPMAMLPRLNGIYGRGYDGAAAELKPVIMAVTKLEHRARSVLRDAARAAPQDEGARVS
jgi:HNH endonuclease